MPGKLRPAREAVFTGEGKLCLGEGASAARLIRCVQVLRDSIDRGFDAVIHLDRTRAVEPLERTARWHDAEPPETYPSAL